MAMDKCLEYEGVIEFSKAEGCYGTIDLIDGSRQVGEVDLVDALYRVLGLGDGLAEGEMGNYGVYPYRRVRARIVIEALSEVETSPYAKPGQEPVDFTPPPPPDE